MKDVFDEYGNVGTHGHTQSRHAEGHHDKRLHGSLLANELDALLQAAKDRFGGLFGQISGRDEGEGNDWCKEGKRIQAKAPLLAQLRQRLTRDCRSNSNRRVELYRIQRDGNNERAPMRARVGMMMTSVTVAAAVVVVMP